MEELIENNPDRVTLTDEERAALARVIRDAGAAPPALARLLDEARAEGWDRGARDASPHGGAYLRSLYAVNPYRKDAND